MEPTPHILLVEDDREISNLVARYLRSNDFRVTVATNGREMQQVLGTARINLVILDIMLPGEDGISLCRRLRNETSLCIIMLTARSEDLDRILGLEMGADDYVTKPFNPRELLARVKAVLRRTRNAAHLKIASSVLSFAEWRIDLARRRLFNPEGARVALTAGEFELLRVFCERPRLILSRDQLLDLTQGRSAAALERSIDILVSRLRQKLERNPRDPELIKTVRAGGYVFSPEVIEL